MRKEDMQTEGFFYIFPLYYILGGLPVKKLVSLLLAAMMLVTMMGGCAGKDAEKPVSAPADTTTAEKPEEKKEEAKAEAEKPAEPARKDLVLYSSADIGTLDPMAAMTGADTIVVGQCYESLLHYLYEYAADGSTVTSTKPLLAESWDFSEDNLTITFHLKKGVKFHNGTDMKAADVIYSFERALNSETKKPLMQNYVSAEATDDYTVVMKLSDVVPTLLYNVSQIPVLSKSYMEEKGEEAILEGTMGTGPYMLTDHQVAQSFSLKAFEDYHRGAAQIKEVRYDIIADPASALMAFEAGSFDYFTVSGNDVDRIKENGEWNVVDYSVSYPRCVYLNHNNGIFNDVRVRQAMAYATNKQNLVDLVQNGKGAVANPFFHPELMVNTSAPDHIFEYDLEKAKKLLAEAGYPNGEGIPTLKLETMETHKDYAVSVQQDYAALGINVELVFLDANTYVSDLTNGNYDIAVNVANLSNFVYPWGRIFESKYLGQTNFAQVNDPKIDELFEKIAVTMDDEEQKVLIHELINYITENVTYLPLTYTDSHVAYDKKLKVDVHPMSAGPYYMHWEA